MLFVQLLSLICFVGVVLCVGPSENSIHITLIDSNRTIDGVVYPSYSMIGSGANWKDVGGGLMGYVIPESQPFSVTYENQLANEESIVHAHGMTPPSNLDGVPYLSSVPIKSGRSVFYEYTLDTLNRGTYFLHSHFGFQFGNGLVAPLIIEGNDPNYPLYDELENAQDIIMLLEDLCPRASGEYKQKLQNGIDSGTATPRNDFNRDMDEPKGDCSSWKTFLALAYDFSESYYEEEFTCQNFEAATDSDVLYQEYLANGNTYRTPKVIGNIDFSTPIRYRVINAGGMTNFQLSFPFPVTLVTTDGQYVNPYTNSTFWISVAQRLDFLIIFPSGYTKASLPVLAWTENFVKSSPAILILSSEVSLDERRKEMIGNEVKRTLGSFDVPYATGMMTNDMEFYLTAFIPLESKPITNYQDILLTGDNGFRGINHHSYRLPPTAPLPFQPNHYPITVNYGDRVQLNIQNENADGHPMHLHGHQFQVTSINSIPIDGAMRDVIFVPGGCSNVTVAFDAINPGLWAFHCHLEFHLSAGMLTTVEYN